MKKEYPKKKFSIFKEGEVKPIKSSYEDKVAPTICDEHIYLANRINDLITDEKVRRELLEKVDILYDMGKRMGNKLLEYHTKYGKKKGWREGY